MLHQRQLERRGPLRQEQWGQRGAVDESVAMVEEGSGALKKERSTDRFVQMADEQNPTVVTQKLAERLAGIQVAPQSELLAHVRLVHRRIEQLEVRRAPGDPPGVRG